MGLLKEGFNAKLPKRFCSVCVKSDIGKCRVRSIRISYAHELAHCVEFVQPTIYRVYPMSDSPSWCSTGCESIMPSQAVMYKGFLAASSRAA